MKKLSQKSLRVIPAQAGIHLDFIADSRMDSRLRGNDTDKLIRMKPRNITPEQIDAILPQTQCGLCGFGGCMPYAKALAQENAPINLCPPGGVAGLLALGKLLEEDATPFIADLEKQTKPKLLAVIREAECIGCTKCIQACPVDAILGGGKLMHTVIADECTGCELCVAPCPVDCIDLVADPRTQSMDAVSSAHARERFQFREQRLSREKNGAEKNPVVDAEVAARKAYIEAALLRAKQKKI